MFLAQQMISQTMGEQKVHNFLVKRFKYWERSLSGQQMPVTMPGITIWASQNNQEMKSEALLHQWSVHKNLKKETFKGIDLNDIPQVEDFFKVSINIHTLLDADTAVSVYLSSCRYPSTMYCHLWGQHLSFISNFNAFAKRFHCHLCDKLFKTLS